MYCDGWNRKMGRAFHVLDEQAARRRFESGGEDDWFSVAAYDRDNAQEDAVPAYVLEVTPRAEVIRTFFYTPARNLRREFIFRQRDRRMFFDTVYEWVYPDDDREYLRGDALRIFKYRFYPDGTAYQDVKYPGTRTGERTDYCDVKVDDLWLDIPQFGDWEPFGNRNQG